MPRAYPRIGAYVGVRSGGLPLVRLDGTLDSAVCQQFSRFPQVALDMNALLNAPSIVPTLKSLSPSIEIAGYHLTAHWYLDPSFTPRAGDVSFDAQWHNTIKNSGGFVPAPRMVTRSTGGTNPPRSCLRTCLPWGSSRPESTPTSGTSSTRWRRSSVSGMSSRTKSGSSA